MKITWFKFVALVPIAAILVGTIPSLGWPVLAQDRQSAAGLYDEGLRLAGERTEVGYRRALERFQQALALFQQQGDRLREADTLSSLGFVYTALGQNPQAITTLQQALAIHRQLGSRAGEARTLINLGAAHNRLGQSAQALLAYQQARDAAQATGDRSLMATALNNLGITYHNTGQPQQSLEHYQRSLALLQELGDRRREATTTANIAAVYESTGQLQEALRYNQQAQSLYQQLGDRSGQATILNNLGVIYNNLGLYQQSLEQYQKSLELLNQLGDRARQASTLANIGGAYEDLNQLELSLDYYQRALLILRELGDRRGEAITLSNLGSVYTRLNRLQQALESYQQSLPIQREVGNRRGEGISLANIGLAYLNLNQLRLALETLQQALALTKATGDRPNQAYTLYNLAMVQKQLGDLTTALQNIQAAIAIVEDIRGQLLDPEFRTSYFVTVQNYYKLQVEILMQMHQRNPDQGYAAQAFNVTERAKARTLLELLSEARADIRSGIDPQLLELERNIQQQITQLDQRRLDNPAEPNSQREALQIRYRNLQEQIRTASPRYAALQYPQPLTLEQIQQQLLDEDTLILSYFLGDRQSYLWLIGKNGSTAHVLPNQGRISALVNQRALPALTNPRASRSSVIEDITPLANQLLGPVADQLGNKRLVVIGDGALLYLPFGALPDPRVNGYQPLLVNNEVVFLPSASTLKILRDEARDRPRAPKEIAVLADPVFSPNDERVRGTTRNGESTGPPIRPVAQRLGRAALNGEWERLPGTRREAENILKLFESGQSLALLDFQASRENISSNQMSQYRFIHWATHGFVNTRSPELSGLVLSLVDQNQRQRDGYLLLGDIFNLSFNADLVVLSACQTGLGEVVQGEGLVGLTRGLMYAGTSRVITSLWEVDDDATANLMSRLYEKMLQQNLPPAAALRAAQLEVLQQRSWVAPYYWAAFTLQGEWQ